SKPSTFSPSTCPLVHWLGGDLAGKSPHEEALWIDFAFRAYNRLHVDPPLGSPSFGDRFDDGDSDPFGSAHAYRCPELCLLHRGASAGYGSQGELRELRRSNR